MRPTCSTLQWKETLMQKQPSEDTPKKDTASTPTRSTQSLTPDETRESADTGEKELELAQLRVELKQEMLDMARTGRLSRLARKRKLSRLKTSTSSPQIRRK